MRSSLKGRYFSCNQNLIIDKHETLEQLKDNFYLRGVMDESDLNWRYMLPGGMGWLTSDMYDFSWDEGEYRPPKTLTYPYIRNIT